MMLVGLSCPWCEEDVALDHAALDVAQVCGMCGVRIEFAPDEATRDEELAAAA
jgi:uncharacterized protein (DUF983 family)